MAELYLYLDDERTPPDRGFTRKSVVTTIRSYSEFKKLIEAVEANGDEIVYVSLDWHLGQDKETGTYKSGEDCLELMLAAEAQAQLNGKTIFANDVMFNAHSSNIEMCGRMIRRFHAATGK